MTEPYDLGERLQKFAGRIMNVYNALPSHGLGATLRSQLSRSGMSVGAHFAEASHSKSAADFVSKCSGARQELEETLYWINLVIQAKLVKESRLKDLVAEGRELIAILVTMTNKAKRRIHA